LSKFDLNSKYIPLFKGESRYYVISGGRGSGKSYSVNTFLLMLTYETGHTILFTRYTLTSAHVSIIPEFIKKIETGDLQNDFYITKDEIINKKTGSKIIFKGIKTSSGNQTANLKSLSGITCFVLDEAEELIDEDIFDKIDLSIRNKEKQNRVILILNPATKTHFIYHKFFENQGVQEGSNTSKNDITYIHTTYLDNKENLSESFISQIENIKVSNPNKYQHTILGGWLNRAEGVVYSNWQIGNFIDTGYNFFGQDYGFSIDPTTLVKCSINRKTKTIFVKQYLYESGLTTSQIAEYNKRYTENRLIIADSAEPRLIAELKNKGCNIKGIAKPKIIDRIALMQDWNIVVDPESKDIIKELNNYVWHDKKSETAIDAYNHLLDPIGYVLWEVIGAPKQTISIKV
jgi:phage terminase large subunit